jgi:hypothetical protein
MESHAKSIRAPARKVATMLYKRYGKTGKEISAIGFGGMRFANPEDIDANARIVLHAHRLALRGLRGTLHPTPAYQGKAKSPYQNAA